MGVPKFYRWISERYPNISRVINDNQIPDFDNFYLDMNGIIHACSHINDDKSESAITEEEIFRNIFHYIDFLFRMIKPKKVFFMAVDGVAPRAKMNQQRSRRFRAGRDRTKKLKTLSEKTGQTLTETIEQHFDTNSITPGTKFMSNLDEQLRYFINVKISTDPLWHGVKVHLSGHLTPGEGEHKIMEYIRFTRSAPGYDVNTRHCLYGLDADLIMLGLVTHEMHFALLREEVKFGGKKLSKIPAPEDINWHLLQLCVLRDYIDLEFRSMRNQLKFPYDLESIIDDWILMGYLVGNDFIPHLPHVHINQEALPLLWNTYKKVLPTLNGYMNEEGELILSRFEAYLNELSKYDFDRFEKENSSSRNTERFTSAKPKQSELDKDQVQNTGFSPQILEKLKITSNVPTKVAEQDSNGQMIDRFIANEHKPHNIYHHSLSTSSSDNNHRSDQYGDDDARSSDSGSISNGDDEKPSSSTADTPNIRTLENMESRLIIDAEFRQFKIQYYREKMRIDITSDDQLQACVYEYIEALQWILKYYYKGCPSWSWFYPRHYSPYLSDIKNFKDLSFNFTKGTPFKPFEQLLAVLPPSSRNLLPDALQPLMVDINSPLLQFYPEDFSLDQNEKKQDWEAIVLLPFIDEQLLLTAIGKHYRNLTNEEKLLNRHVGAFCYEYTQNPALGDGLLKNNPYFPELKETNAKLTELSLNCYESKSFECHTKRFDEKNMKYFPKFPILNVLPYKYDFKKGAVEVFESRSTSTTLVLKLTHQPDSDLITYSENFNPKAAETTVPFQINNRKALIDRYLGKRIFVNWPHFEYGLVCAITDFQSLYIWSNIPGGSCLDFRSLVNEDYFDNRYFNQSPIYVARSPFEYPENGLKSINQRILALDAVQQNQESTKAANLARRYEIRQGVDIGAIPLLLYVCPLIGYRTKCASTTKKSTTNACFANHAFAYPLQTSLLQIDKYRHDLYSFPESIDKYLCPNDRIFILQAPYYSCYGTYVNLVEESGKLFVQCLTEPAKVTSQPDFHQPSRRLDRSQLRYWSAQDVAAYLQTMPSVISKITGSIIITTVPGKRESNANVGLSWKLNKPLKQLYGYTKKKGSVWLYSDDAVIIISDYMLRFPEIVAELVKRPKDDSYSELSIWPNKAKSRLQEIRSWLKQIPTHSIPLTSGAWDILDKSVIVEIDRMTKEHYSKQASKNINEKVKTIMIEPQNIFKTTQYLGMCDGDFQTTYEMYDRVVTVRLGTGVPIGSRGTIVGILIGLTYMDTYYEVLFDDIPKTSLDNILLAKNQQQCRIKVHSYHLLNYSHSLRTRSISSSERSNPQTNAWADRVVQPVAVQPVKTILKRETEKPASPNKTDTPIKTNSQEKPKLVDVIFASVQGQASSPKTITSIPDEKTILSQIPIKPTVQSQIGSVNKSSTPPVSERIQQQINQNNTKIEVTESKSKDGSTTNPNQEFQTPLLLRALKDSQQIVGQSLPNTQSIEKANITENQSHHNKVNYADPRIQINEGRGFLDTSQKLNQTSSIENPINSNNVLQATTATSAQTELFLQAIRIMNQSNPSATNSSVQQTGRTMNNTSMSYSQVPGPPTSLLAQAMQQSNQLNTHGNVLSFGGSPIMPNMSTTNIGSQNLSTNTLLGPNFSYNQEAVYQSHPQSHVNLQSQQMLPQIPLQTQNVQQNQTSVRYQQQPQTPARNDTLNSNATTPVVTPPQPTHASPSSQQVTSPRSSGGSTLQFVPSQVLRNIPKKS